MSSLLRFDHADLQDDLPLPGYYPATIDSAQLRHSKQGNQMLQVIFRLEGVHKRYAQVSDYFVLEGASPQGITTARRRLVHLCRACNLTPRVGDTIPIAELEHATLQVKLCHDQFRGEKRLKVVAYQQQSLTDLDVPF
jgi:hypothetical protein